MIRKKIPRLDSERKCIFLITFTTEHQFKFILSYFYLYFISLHERYS